MAKRVSPARRFGLLALVFVLLAAGWQVVQLVRTMPRGRIGDGTHVETYGFDLSTCLVPTETLVAGGIPKDGIPVLDFPAVTPGSEAIVPARGGHRGKFLVSSDRVIGVVRNGRARAYPLRMLAWHEVVNDTLGGKPILVTYSPLGDAAVVFDRRVPGLASAGPGRKRPLEFGVSGLLYNSNLLMYDRRDSVAEESLWSQLQFRAIAGPAAARGARLTVIPCDLVHWSDWIARHPETSVLKPDPAVARRYERDPYGSYYGNDLLRFPVKPLPADRFLPKKTPTLIVGVGDVWRVFPLPALAARADSNGQSRGFVGRSTVRFTYRDDPPAAWVERERGDPITSVCHAFWFAWYSMRPESDVAR
jgi:hypothetical protein